MMARPTLNPELRARPLISHGDIVKRGWRVGSIARLLKKPDKLEYPFYKSFSTGETVQSTITTKSYYLDRVIAIEGTAPWLAEKAAEASATAKRDRPMISVAGRKVRGWTKSMVEKLLGEPDRFGTNMHGGAPTRLYFLDRIEATEATDAFAAAQDAAAARVARGFRARAAP
jgi:hypothetical protein